MSGDIRSTIQKRDDKGVVRHGGEWLAIWSDPNSLKSDAEKREAFAQDQQLRDIETSLAVTARSMAKRDIDVVFGSDAPSSIACVALPRLTPDGANLAALRGLADAGASFAAHHDPDLHLSQTPKTPIDARFFRLLEHVRCEALEARILPGVQANLVAHHIDRLQRSQLFHAHLASLLPLSEALRMVCRDVFLNAPEPSLQTAGFRMWDRWLRERFQTQFDAMSTAVADQQAYGEAAKGLISALLAELPSAGARQRALRSDPAETGEAGEQDDLIPDNDPANAPLFDPGDLEIDVSDATTQVSADARARPTPYNPFTTAHDRVVPADQLENIEGLREARKALDEKLADYRQEVSRLANKLQRRLMAQQARNWEFDLDEGLIDAAKLDRVIINPGFDHAFKQEADSPFRDTIVTLLIDNSGSMRGKQVETACVVAEILAAALERCAVSTEILGFTTSGWKGGKSHKDWIKAGKPAAPGRLNDLLHVVYKDADTPLRRARESICAMLSPGLLKENIDGEALMWAAGRLLRRPEQRKLLIVLSDGAPVDQATLEKNEDTLILDRHLREVITGIETGSGIELSAIGIKHDVSGYYPVSRQVDRVEDLAEAAVDLVDRYLVRSHRS